MVDSAQKGLEKLDIGDDAPNLGRRNRRTAVSAEPTTLDELKTRRKAKKVPKDDAERESIMAIFRKSFLFTELDDGSLKDIADIVFQKDFKDGDKIITQGEAGDYFYVLYMGQCECYVHTKHVKTYLPGEGFGELALMYNKPRAATVVASGEAKCWVLDRDSFKLSLMEHTQKKRDLYEAFLEGVPLLSSLVKYERLTVADALRSNIYQKGEEIVTQGDAGEEFFIVEKGTCQVIVDGNRAGEIECGGYFGELALLNDEPRAATIRADSPEVKVLSIDRTTFTGALGPLHVHLKRDAQLYEEMVKKS